MLVKCPKCGFEQPKDRFCANCGIDVDNYRPGRRGGRGPATNSIYYLLLLVLVFCATAWFLYQRTQHPQDNSTIASQTGVTERLSTVTPTPSLPKPAPTPAEAVTQAPATPVTVEMARVQEQAPTNASFVIYLAEVPAELLREIAEDRTSRSESDVILFTDFRSRVLNNSNVRLLDPPDTKSITSFEEPIQHFSGSRDARLKTALGMYISLLPLSTDAKMIHSKVEFRKVLRAAQGDTTETQNLTKEVTIPEGSTAAFVNLLPKGRRPSESDETAYQASFLKILSSDRFMSGQSEFVVFIEATSVP